MSTPSARASARAPRRTLAAAGLAIAALAGSAITAPAAIAADPPPTSLTPSLTSFADWTLSVPDTAYDYELTTKDGAPAFRFSNAKGSYGAINQVSTPAIAEVGERTVTTAKHRILTAEFTIDADDYQAQPGLAIEVSIDKKGNRSGGNVMFRHDEDEKLTLSTYWADADSAAELEDWNNDTAVVDFTGALDIRIVSEYIANGPDSIRVFVDGELAIAGQAFEAYHLAMDPPTKETSNSLLFRAVDRAPVEGGAWEVVPPTADEKADLLGHGFYFSGIHYAATDKIALTASIAGTAALGQTLTASAATDIVNPTLKYQWMREDLAIAGATKSTYKVSANDVGKRIRVKVTASKSGWTAVSAQSARTATIPKGTLAWAAEPEITGTARLARTLTAHAATTPGATYKYQWYRNGSAIKNAVANTYRLAAADVGKQVTVKITASKTGYATISMTSDPTAEVEPGNLTVGTPSVSGTYKVGGKIVAKAGTWTKDTTLKYAFYADGELVRLTPSPNFTLTWQEKGKRISVIVIGAKPGYVSAESVETTPRGPVK